MEKRKAIASVVSWILVLGVSLGNPATAQAVERVSMTGVLHHELIFHVTKTDVPTRTGKVSPKTSKAYARYKAKQKYNWGSTQFQCLSTLWQAESGWNHRADNPSSGAYGIPQSLPGNKMAQAGSDWRTNPETQINWGLSYIKSRYGNPCGALNHFYRFHWY